ncbi:hypothetical protein [Cupriavidus pinatubonensis]|uniref:hypothetical protein n=1 Tax=Cupriavidus pinatubonensis TaxID=248026 RepID=UPI00112E0E87|nr:hypothetical protein [Cupriavidus pinatubonensis]TPQ35719.1 hypothetical protein C2U69_20495 [Cupriavidus pinatubonensis]
MSCDQILHRLEHVDVTGYNRATADCPICDRRIAVQWDADGRAMIRCARCAVADILIAIGLGRSALTPPGLKPMPWPRRWWTKPPRYPGAVMPMGER